MSPDRTGAQRGHGNRWLIGAVLAGALALRVGLVAATPHLRLGTDPTDYDRLGRLLAAGHGWGPSLLAAGRGPTAFRPPLYPLFLAGIYKLTGGSLAAARLVEALLGTVTVALIAWIASRLMGRRVAAVAAVLAAVYPPFIVYSTAVLSESIFVPLELGALALVLRAGEDDRAARWWSAAAGALVGLGILARPNSFVLLLPLGVLVGASARRAANAVAPRVLRPALLVGCALLVVTPWLIRDAVVMHAPVPVSDIDAFNLAGVYNRDSASASFPYRYQFRPPVAVNSMLPLFHDPRLNEVALSDALRSRGLSYLDHHVIAVPEAMFWNTYRLVDLAGREESRLTTAEAGYGPTLALTSMLAWFALAALALVGTFTGLARRLPIALLAMPVTLWVVTVPFLGTARLRNPIEPFVVLLAAAGLVTILDRLSRAQHADQPPTALRATPD